MAHLHSVYDTDAHFQIDGVTRAVKNASTTKTMVVQHDHNSERFTFEIPRMIDGHDMSTCNVVQVHYINIDSSDKTKQNSGIYEVDDLQISPESEDVVICSWLISANATQYVGNLSFIVRFACTTNGVVDYAWNTAVHSSVFVSKGIFNGDVIAEEYADILEQWRRDLEEAATVNDEEVKEAVNVYFAKNPIGKPIVISAASSMTDTTAIYLYTGTENGFKQGDWYYHNGSAWVSGGTYGGEASGLYDGSVFYGHISEITYEGEPTEDEIVPDEPEEVIVNLFDKDTMVQNAYMNTYQAAHTIKTNSTARFATIPVEVGKAYSMSAVVDGVATSLRLASYGIFFMTDENTAIYGTVGSYNKRYDVDSSTWVMDSGSFTLRGDDNGIGQTAIIPDGIAYIGIGLRNTNAATTELTDYLMFEEGTACHDYVAYSADGDDGASTETPDVSAQGNLAGCEITGMFGATLADTYARRNLSVLAGKMEGMTGLSDDTIIDSGLRKFGYAIEPALDDIPTVYANGDSFADMTKDKNEVQMSFRYISKTKVFGGWMKIKWQGNLSLNFSKKNFTVKLYGDKTMKHKLKVDLRGWGKQNKFVWKANYVDRSHARNIVSARLWSDMVASRPTYDARLMYSPNHGAVDGFPFRLYVNGEYYGLMTWNIPKDGWMAEMTEDNKNHCILCAEINNPNGGTSCDFAADYNSSAWSVEFPDEISNGLKYSFNDIIACVVNDTDEDFKANINNHLDIHSALDYYLFFYLNGGGDSLAKNMLLFTYDGKKWYCGAYDMDGVWGRTYNGTVISATAACPESYEAKNSLLWKRIEACFGQELRDRYFELRETILSKEYIMAKFEQFENQIPEEMFTEDQTKNGMIGVSGSAFLTELGAWLDGRFTYVDAEMEAMVTT